MFAQNDQLAKINRLIEQAEHFRRHGEDGSADAALTRADAMMVKYAIDRAFVEANKTRFEREQPTSVDIAFTGSLSPWRSELREMLTAVAESCRIRVALRGDWNDSMAILVGFASDIEYARMLWNGLYFAFVAKLDPSWDDARTVDENIKILKEAGRKWAWIATEANTHGFTCTANDGKLKAAYRRQCKAEGVEPQPHTQRHEAYRAAYAQSFAQTIRWRLRRQQDNAEDIINDTPGSALVLADRTSDVDVKFYEMFPNLKPMTDEQWNEWLARDKDRQVEETARLAALSPKERANEEQAQKRAQARWATEADRQRARRMDTAGKAAGHAAASTVDLGATKLPGAQS